jgi:site-specific recombinase XerD
VADIAGPPVGRAGHREAVTRGLRALLCVRAFQPPLTALRSNRILGLAETFRMVEGDPFLDRFFDEVARSGRSATVRTAAALDVTYALLSQGIGLRDLTPEALLHCGVESRRLRVTPGVVGAANRLAGGAAWDVLHRMGHFAPGAPHSLKAAYLNGGQRTATELVDRHHISCAEIRQVLIEYLERRRAECDYSSWSALSLRLVGQFWKQIELIDPGQKDLRLSSHTYEQWAAGLRVRTDGRTRLRPDSILATVRTFYLDLQSWAIEEPDRWAQWVAPCPVRPGTGRRSRALQRRVSERTADRIRERQPWLPTLVAHVEQQHTRLRDFLAASQDIAAGVEFSHAGCVYRRTNTAHDRQMVARDQTHVRVVDVLTGEVTNLTLAEDTAFWTWACIETLRHTGLRIEELLELNQLSIRQYERPNGELIGLLVVAPSKTDRERVVPMSAELFHGIAEIVRRHTAGGAPIRAVRRWDPHERVWSEPMPFLFQRPLISAGAMSFQSVRESITRQCEQIAATNSAFAGLRLTPHDFRRLFATELVNNGLPIHIGAKLLGHLDLATTQGYVAVFEEDTVRHYQDFLAAAVRCARATSTARSATRSGWSSKTTSTSARSSSARARGRMEPRASTNTPACAARCCTSTPGCCRGSTTSRPT